MNCPESEVHDVLRAINRSWLENRPSDMRSCLHPDVTMVLPGFSGTIVGREALLAGFEEWCLNARVLEYNENDEQIQIVGNLGFASFRFDMLYERTTYRERSTGRDLWVFERTDGNWVAVWRTMVELVEARQAVP